MRKLGENFIKHWKIIIFLVIVFIIIVLQVKYKIISINISKELKKFSQDYSGFFIFLVTFLYVIVNYGMLKEFIKTRTREERPIISLRFERIYGAYID